MPTTPTTAREEKVMSEEMDANFDPVEQELEGHRVDVQEWKKSLSEKEIPESQKGVVDRFKRDCDTLDSDLPVSSQVSANDLCDFVERRNSLEIQYHNILKSLS